MSKCNKFFYDYPYIYTVMDPEFLPICNSLCFNFGFYVEVEISISLQLYLIGIIIDFLLALFIILVIFTQCIHLNSIAPLPAIFSFRSGILNGKWPTLNFFLDVIICCHCMLMLLLNYLCICSIYSGAFQSLQTRPCVMP